MINSFSHVEYEYTFSSTYQCTVLLANYCFWYYMYMLLKKDRCDPGEAQLRFVVGVVVTLCFGYLIVLPNNNLNFHLLYGDLP
jgi:hypothetical protein